MALFESEKPCDLFAPACIHTGVSAKSAFAIDVPESLLAEARRGELAAFERIYRLFEQPAYTLALRLLGDREEAQDAMQDSMLRIFRHLSDFRGDAPFWGWLRQITLNESLMRLRRRGRLDGVMK